MGRTFTFAALLILAASIFSAPQALAHSYTLGDLMIGHVWAPVPGEGATTLPVYVPLMNRGEEPVRLIAASSPIAADVRFRKAKDGEAEWLPAIEVGPGAVLALAAWREHIWLTGLNRQLGEGDTFPLTLDFGAAGEITIEVMVEQSPGH